MAELSATRSIAYSIRCPQRLRAAGIKGSVRHIKLVQGKTRGRSNNSLKPTAARAPSPRGGGLVLALDDMIMPPEPSRIPTAEEIVAALDDRRPWVTSSNGSKLHGEYGLCALVPLYAEALPQMRNANARTHIMFWLIPLARRDARVVEVAKERLSDRSAAVRMHACEVLAYSLLDDVIPYLEPLLQHPVAETRTAAAAAIDAIKNQNHHYYVDRKHTGTSFWVVNPEDDPKYEPRRWQVRQHRD